MYNTFIRSTSFVLCTFEKKEERRMADLIYCILFIFLAASHPRLERHFKLELSQLVLVLSLWIVN